MDTGWIFPVLLCSKTSNHLENPNKIQATGDLDVYSKKVLLPWTIYILKGPNNKRNVIISFKNVGWRTEQRSDLLNGLGLS